MLGMSCGAYGWVGVSAKNNQDDIIDKLCKTASYAGKMSQPARRFDACLQILLAIPDKDIMSTEVLKCMYKGVWAQ